MTPAPRKAAAPEGFEHRLAQRWLVWLGGATLALAAVFLVKYSVEAGLLGPTARCVLGGAAGLLVLAGGEWLRRHPAVTAPRRVGPAAAHRSPAPVPSVLTAAGLSAVFTSLYAAHGLYGLVPGPVAFVLMGLVALAGFALARLHGPVVAVVGVLGGFAVPALVSSEAPSPAALFSYLAVLFAVALAVVRAMAWWWLAWMALAGAAGWAGVWLALEWRPGDVAVLTPYAVALAGAGLILFRGLGHLERPLPIRELADSARRPDTVAWTAAVVAAVLIFLQVPADGHSTAALVAVGLMAAAALALGRRRAAFDGLVVVAAGLAVLVLVLWPAAEMRPPVLPPELVPPRRAEVIDPDPVPESLFRFLGFAGTVAVLFGAGALALLDRTARPLLWAAVAAAVPPVVLAVAYWRVTAFSVDPGWSALALALAAVDLGIARWLATRRGAAGSDEALAAFAVAVPAAIAVAAAMALREAWLTVALALQLPVLAWVAERLRVPSLRKAAWVVAAVVLARLALNPHILGYGAASGAGARWILYGYGIPLLAFLAAARRFRRQADDRLVTLLEAGGLAFAVLLVSFEARVAIAGTLDAPGYTFEEQCLNTIAWAALAYGLFRRYGLAGRAVPTWGWRILGGAATVQAVALMLAGNPMLTGFDVGAWPVANWITLAYGGPGILALLFHREARCRGAPRLAGAAGAVALGLLFLDLTLEVRHGFHGGVLRGGVTSDGEWYAYSAAWLAFAGGLLVIGIRSGRAVLRHASLALVLATVGKVFLFDASALAGLYRVGSFVALGGTLVAIGHLYRRFVFPPSPSEPPGTG